ncbi:uncharacterized protein L969DRAFT_21721 [Mixia osmundae IAM 14324]|uniref:GST C-terminal domain-containing protein n=1 Tax=Mixia osmundae (strain CBS 9802 / IAM 14324 / JCM 22182 / KY 12970) TaxID=764103 RepID=G7DTF1_MIXOS|nr:uncharacterized protein L969DRAFT_21721 [Mixia osmundae IAM 14324]KEI42863.1 hypothetical protein L969DRAFT_21721 [Mixia osmundae IAM 14324]GAA93798.1 hypothetical protein E5Q_00444 [Mixia osmundae IAM 14324]
MTSAKEARIYTQADKDGQFRRQNAFFRDTISADHPVFKPDSGRYLLYVNTGCPWANRTILVRNLLKLQDHVDITYLAPILSPDGWYWDGKDGADERDPIWGHHLIRDVYHSVEPSYDLRYTVPVLLDKQTKRIVSNESSEIIRMLYTFPSADSKLDLYPLAMRSDIDALNEWIYNDINNGVYKTGFAASQAVYDEHVRTLFRALDRLEALLSSDGRQYLLGSELTEADVRLYPTIARFDISYHYAFRCNLRKVSDYPALQAWFKRLYAQHEFRSATHFDQIKVGYTMAAAKGGWDTQTDRPIVPAGPVLDL